MPCSTEFRQPDTAPERTQADHAQKRCNLHHQPAEKGICLAGMANGEGFPKRHRNPMIALRLMDMKSPPTISEKRAAVLIWIGAAVFTVGAMIFGH